MERQALTTSQDYFREVLTANRDAYFEGPVTFAAAFNFAGSLFHFHEWLFVDFKDALQLRFSAGLSEPKQFWRVIEATDQRFGYIRDVANASKHVRLTWPSTGLRHIREASLGSIGFGEGDYGVGRYGGPNFLVQDGSRTVTFDECAQVLFDTWSNLLDELTAEASQEIGDEPSQQQGGPTGYEEPGLMGLNPAPGESLKEIAKGEHQGP